MSSEEIILETVRENPGIGFTELKEKTGLANGTLQYHIRSSERIVKRKNAILEADTCEKCEHKEDCGSKCFKNVLRDERKEKITEEVKEGKPKTDIAEELGLDPSTVSYHINQLKKLNIL